MIADLKSVAEMPEFRAPAVRRRLLLLSAGWVAFEWMMLLAVMKGLERMRFDGSTAQPALMFVAALGASYWIRARTDLAFMLRVTAAARARVEAIASRLHRLPLIEFERIGRGTLTTRLMGDGNLVAQMGKPLGNMVVGVLRTVVAVAFIAVTSTDAAVVAGVASLLIIVVNIGQFTLMSDGFRQIARTEADLLDVLRDQQHGAVALRLHQARARDVDGTYRGLSTRLRAVRARIWSGYFERQFAYNAIVYALLGINVFVLPAFVELDHNAVRDTNIAVLFLFLAIVRLVFAVPKISRGAQAVRRLDALGLQLDDDALEPADHAVGRGRFADFRRIDVEGLTFAYPDIRGRDGFVAGPVSAAFQRGELVFVTGHNGSGKSTFLKMLCGLYARDEGEIRVDGETIETEDLPHLRALFGTILVDHHLFDRVVDGGGESDARAAALLDEMGLTGKTAIEGGRVSEIDLSTGQKKRLAMVIARLRDRPIMLFDEWAADQDPGFRAWFYHTLLPRLRDAGKLVIVVTHDDQYFGLADRTLHFADGRLAADGGGVAR